MTGLSFGELLVIKQNGNTKNGGAIWECLCSCGQITYPIGSDLRAGKVASCGHNNSSIISARVKTHGQSKTRLYAIWNAMHARCKSRPGYIKKNIVVCAEWFAFEPFWEWAKHNGYAETLSIDRIDNSKGYNPDNCRWATATMQSRNRDFVNKNADGVLWRTVAKENGITNAAYTSRIAGGWSFEEASTWPMFKKRFLKKPV